MDTSSCHSGGNSDTTSIYCNSGTRTHQYRRCSFCHRLVVTDSSTLKIVSFFSAVVSFSELDVQFIVLHRLFVLNIDLKRFSERHLGPE